MILITGGTGANGTELLKALSIQGVHVRVAAFARDYASVFKISNEAP